MTVIQLKFSETVQEFFKNHVEKLKPVPRKLKCARSQTNM